MDKNELHTKLATATGSVVIPVDDFVAIYGNDKTKTFKGQELTRADILANTYNLDVIREGDNYVFARKE